MPRVSEIVVAIEAEGEERVLAALKQVDGAQIKSVQNTKQLGAQTKQATEQASEGWATLVTGVNQAMGAMKKVVKIGKAVYDFTKQGAQLEFLAGKFERLSLAAGTTSDVLLNDLRKATQGTRSDMELMASAGDFMSLGLAKTSDEVIRLTTVAGALNMDMNQLVLTLANQTTMRFDQLGVSVDGFKEKVAGLEAAGMSANDAFKEAFLQQAEEQVRKVGNAADSSLGSFMQFEASIQNTAAAIKSALIPAINEALPFLTGISDALGYSITNTQAFNATMLKLNAAYASGVITEEQYKQALVDVGYELSPINRTMEGLEITTLMLNEAYIKAGGAVDMTAEKTIALEIELAKEKNALEQIPEAAGAAGDATLQFAGATERAALTIDNFLEKAVIFKDDFAEIFSLSKNLGGMISFAKSYDQIMGEIAATEAELAKMPYWKQVGKAGDEAKEKIKGLKAELSDMANQVTLDMFQATIAIGGVTRTEMEAYFDMAEQMGLISHDAAQAAIAAYDDAIATINGMTVDEKTGNIYVNAEQALATITMVNQIIQAMQNGNVDLYVQFHPTGEMTQSWADNNYDFSFSPQDVPVVAKLDSTEVDDYSPEEKDLPTKTVLDTADVDAWVPPTKYGTVIYTEGKGHGPLQAIGGPVYPNNNYLWQEPNREGELFIPEQYGRVMNNHQVAQMMRDAMFLSPAAGARAGGGTVSTDNSRHASYTINAMYKQEPAITLSQHLQILNYLGGRA